jgi:TRAP-type uncharacterized transport system substrate-binding protein
MKRIALAALAILTCAVAGWSQAYYEASGQTRVFTLAAGAKSGPVAIRGGSVMRTGKDSGINFAVTRGGIVVTLSAANQQGSADIALYDLTGRQIYRQHGYCGTSLRLETKAFSAGVYTALVRVDGKNYSRRFAVSRRWE